MKGPRKTDAMCMPRHTFRNFHKNETGGERMPLAIFIGHHPRYYMAAATTGPYGVDEFGKPGMASWRRFGGR